MQMFDKLLNVVLVCVVGYFVLQCMSYKKKKKMPLPYMENADEETMEPQVETEIETETKPIQPVSGISEIGSTPLSLNDISSANIELQNNCGEKNIPFLSSHLLPKKEENDENFSEFAPNKDDIEDENFLQSDRFTVTSQSKRNVNYSIRSEPPNPKNIVCPWMQSTIEPDTMRKPLEIGS